MTFVSNFGIGGGLRSLRALLGPSSHYVLFYRAHV